VDEEVLDGNGIPDIEKLQPFVYSPGSQAYHGIGELVGKAFNIGKTLG
jgi:hypothetical protein